MGKKKVEEVESKVDTEEKGEEGGLGKKEKWKEQRVEECGEGGREGGGLFGWQGKGFPAGGSGYLVTVLG